MVARLRGGIVRRVDYQRIVAAAIVTIIVLGGGRCSLLDDREGSGPLCANTPVEHCPGQDMLTDN